MFTLLLAVLGAVLMLLMDTSMFEKVVIGGLLIIIDAVYIVLEVVTVNYNNVCKVYSELTKESDLD